MKNRFKLLYFVQYFTVGIMGPYLAIFLFQKDFSGAQIGFLLGSLPIAGLIFQPVWSYLSDVLHTRRYLLVIGFLGIAVATIGLGLAKSFSMAYLWALLFAILRAPISPVGTAMTLDYLEGAGTSSDFSLIRMWGSLGYAASSFLWGGLFLDHISDYFTWILAGIFLLLTGISMLLPEKKNGFLYSGLKGWQVITKNPKLATFLLASVFIGATYGVHNNYQTLYLQALDASSWLIGLTVSVQALLEVPMMMLAPTLLKQMSMRVLILIGAVVMPIRWLLYAYIKNPVWVLPTQLLNGVSVVSFFVVAVAFVDQLVEPQWRATGQGLYSSAMMGVGSGLGVYLGGLVIEAFKVQNVWYFSFVMGVLGLGLLLYSFNASN
ncbi:MAG: MFS transporter [Anaerolineales bacterium]